MKIQFAEETAERSRLLRWRKKACPSGQKGPADEDCRSPILIAKIDFELRRAGRRDARISQAWALP